MPLEVQKHDWDLKFNKTQKMRDGDNGNLVSFRKSEKKAYLFPF